MRELLHRITTQRLIIQECYDVVPEHVEWLNDKELMRWSEQRWRHHDLESQQRFLTQAFAHDNPRVFDIRLPDGPVVPGDDTRKHLSLPPMNAGATIGSLHAHTDRRHKRADLGIMVGPQYHKHGYAREAWEAVEGFLHVQRGIQKFEAGCVSANDSMIALLQRMGYLREGRRAAHFCIDGHDYSLLMYGKIP